MWTTQRAIASALLDGTATPRSGTGSKPSAEQRRSIHRHGPRFVFLKRERPAGPTIAGDVPRIFNQAVEHRGRLQIGPFRLAPA